MEGYVVAGSKQVEIGALLDTPCPFFGSLDMNSCEFYQLVYITLFQQVPNYQKIAGNMVLKKLAPVVTHCRELH